MPVKRKSRIGKDYFDIDVSSREYKLFKEAEAKKPRTVYEKACAFAERSIKVSPDEKSRKKMQKAIDFAHINVTPEGVASLTILFVLVVCIPTFLLLVLKLFGFFGLELNHALFVFIVSMPIAYYLYIYPYHLKKRFEMLAGSEIVSAVLYMTCHMRNVPSLEGAVDFASKNLTGPLAKDLRKLMWDVRVGNYLSINEALLDYAEKWKDNKEFVESIELLITSLKQTGERRINLLDEAVRVILEGNRDSARHYIQELKMPMMIINAMGVILPIMGLVMFPIIAIFLKVDPSILFIVYDVVLPLTLFFVITRALEKRPATFSIVDISEHPDVPPKGKFFLGKKPVSALPIAVVVSAVIIIFGSFMRLGEIALIESLENTQQLSYSVGVISALVVIFGMVAGPIIYCFLLSHKRMKIRNDVQKIESEFKEAAFQLGNSIGGGVPIERAMDRAIKRMEGLKIRELFVKASRNIKQFNMTFSDAFFDKDYGAILYFPSRLVKSVMRAVSESAKKGVETAAASMISIANYLRGIHRTQEDVNEALNDVSSSLRFQAYILSPLISGVVSTMAVLMIRILESLSARAPSVGSGAPSTFIGIAPDNVGISPFSFILIVGIYLVESLFLLSYLMNGIKTGEDPIGLKNLIGTVLLIGTITFIITVIVTLILFEPLVVSVT